MNALVQSLSSHLRAALRPDQTACVEHAAHWTQPWCSVRPMHRPTAAAVAELWCESSLEGNDSSIRNHHLHNLTPVVLSESAAPQRSQTVCAANLTLKPQPWYSVRPINIHQPRAAVVAELWCKSSSAANPQQSDLGCACSGELPLSNLPATTLH